MTQAQLADLYVEALGDARIRHDVMKEGPLSAAVALARESQRIWEKSKEQESTVAGTVTGGRQVDEDGTGEMGIGSQ